MATRAEAYLTGGLPGEAFQAARDGLAAVARTAEAFYEAELHRLRGEALLAMDGGTAEAASALRTAVDVATRQGANLFALRAAVRLAGRTSGDGGDRDLLIAARRALRGSADLVETRRADVLLAMPDDRSSGSPP